jgi:hypothetical protein
LRAEASELNGADVLSFLALSARRDVELDALTVLERLVALALDLREVDEDVFTLIAGDEAVTLLGIEELHGTCGHTKSFVLVTTTVQIGP